MMMNDKTLCEVKVTNPTSSSCFVGSETEVLCGESTLCGVVSDGFAK